MFLDRGLLRNGASDDVVGAKSRSSVSGSVRGRNLDAVGQAVRP